MARDYENMIEQQWQNSLLQAQDASSPWYGWDPEVVDFYRSNSPAGFGAWGTNMAPGTVLTPQQVQEVIANLNQPGHFEGIDGMTLEQYLADARAHFYQNDQGQFVFSPKRDRAALKGGDFISKDRETFWETWGPIIQLGGMISGPLMQTAGIGSLGAAGAAAGQAGAEFFPNVGQFLGDVAGTGAGVVGTGAGSFTMPIDAGGPVTNAFAPEVATNFGQVPTPDFSLLPEGMKLPNAGLGLNTGGIGLTDNLINMGGGAAAMGVPGGLGLDLGTKGLISEMATNLGLPSDYQPTNPSQVTQSPGPVENRTTPGNRPGTTVGPNGQVIPPINPVTGTAAATVAKLIKDATGYDIDPGLIDVAGKVIGAGVGMYGANQQADATKAIADQYFGMGAPYRNELQNLNVNPSSFTSQPLFQNALQEGSNARARSLSQMVGNPAVNPGAVKDLNDFNARTALDAYNNRWNQLASAGQLGVSQAAPLSQNAVQAGGKMYADAGYGIGQLTNNTPNYGEDFFRRMANRWGYPLS